MRVRKKSWTISEYENNKHIVHNPQQHKGNWNELFGNNNPIYLEIGCGKGRFISQNAILNSDINFIGIERQSTIAATAARNVSECKNVFIIHGDVENILDFFESGEIKRLYINFCDPWPKKKWYKRRLTYRKFLEDYKTLFKDNGEIFFKTDNTILFEFSLNEFCANGWQLSNISLDLHKSDFEGNIMTEYEEKFSGKGFPIYRLEARWNK